MVEPTNHSRSADTFELLVKFSARVSNSLVQCRRPRPQSVRPRCGRPLRCQILAVAIVPPPSTVGPHRKARNHAEGALMRTRLLGTTPIRHVPPSIRSDQIGLNALIKRDKCDRNQIAD